MGRLAALLAALGLALGCSAFEPEQERVQVTTDRATYRAGDEVTPPAGLSPGRERIRFSGNWPSDAFGVVSP